MGSGRFQAAGSAVVSPTKSLPARGGRDVSPRRQNSRKTVRIAKGAPLTKPGEQFRRCEPLDAGIFKVIVARPDRNSSVKGQRQSVDIVGVAAADSPFGLRNALLIDCSLDHLDRK